jgi:D-alanine-D-alanine ligase
LRGSKPKVVVLHNAPVLPTGHPDAVSEADVVDVARTVVDLLARAGWAAEPLAATPPVARLVRELDAAAPDVVFNLIEGFGGWSGGATHVTSLLELMGLPMTGSPAEALAACLSKGRAKALLRGTGLPTAPFALVAPGQPVPDLCTRGPVFVKPDAEDGSLGIDQGSVVADPAALRERVARLHAAYGGLVLVESYLPGAEYNVGVIGLPDLEPLPIAEIVYEPAPGAWPILTYAAKWAAGSAEDKASRARCPAQVDRHLADRLGRLAVEACAATGCRDYVRVDFRLDDRGEPMLLEVNPNPDIGPVAGWARALRASGRDYAATLDAFARQALDRGRASATGSKTS